MCFGQAADSTHEGSQKEAITISKGSSEDCHSTQVHDLQADETKYQTCAGELDLVGCRLMAKEGRKTPRLKTTNSHNATLERDPNTQTN